MPRWKMNSLGAWEETEEYRSPNAGTVYKAPKPQPTAGDKLRKEGVGEDGGYIDSGELAPDGTILESKSFEIDPNKETPTQRQKEREDRLRQRAGSGQQGADIAKKKLPESKQTDLPQFLQMSEKDIEELTVKQKQLRDAQENKEFDKTVAGGSLEDLRKGVDLRKQANQFYEDTGAGGYNRQRQGLIDSSAQFVDDKVTQISGSEKLGDIVRPVSGFIADTFIPTAEEAAMAGAATVIGTPLLGGTTLAALKVKNIIDTAFDSSQNIIKRAFAAKKLAGIGGITPNDLTKKQFEPINVLKSDTLDPKGLRNWGSNKRIAGAKFITGNNVQKEDVFIQAGWKVLVDLNKRFGIDINRAVSPFQVHHKGVVRQIAESANGLTDEAAKQAGEIISKKVGFKLGYDPSNASPLPAKFHQRVHDIINDVISSGWGDNLKGIEKKLNLPPNWQTTMDLQARIDAGIFNSIADGINKHTDTIDKFWNSVATRTNLGKLSRDQYIEATLEVLEQDAMLKNLRRTRNPSPETGYTVTDAVNELLERAGRVDLQSPIFQKVTPDFAEDAYKFALQKDGEKALIEAITTGQDSTAIFKAYGLKTKGFHKLFRQLELPGFTGSKQKGLRGRPEGSKTNPTKLRQQRQRKFDKDPDLNPNPSDIDETKPIAPPDD